jgi:cobalt-zinc-cadmium efflux system outer membrane protein
MTFEEALEAARESPRLARLEADVALAEAALITARTYPHNPDLEVEAAARSGPEGSTTDRGLGISHRIEIAGQRSERRAAADAAVLAARSSLRHARTEVLGAAAQTFVEAAYRQDLLQVEEAEADLARSYSNLVERRLEAGLATAIDLALARAGSARAERAVALAKGADQEARARLTETLGARASVSISPVGEIPPLAAPPSLDEVLSRALDGRGDLAAAEARSQAAEARRRLSRALRIPDLSVAARARREEGDDIVGLSFGIPIRLFDRNQGALAEAEAEVAAARSEVELARLAVEREVVVAYGRFVTALAAREAAEGVGMTALEEGLTLLQRSFETGKIGSAELLLYRRELVEGRRQALAAARDTWAAALELATATGDGLPGFELAGAPMNEEIDE